MLVPWIRKKNVPAEVVRKAFKIENSSYDDYYKLLLADEINPPLFYFSHRTIIEIIHIVCNLPYNEEGIGDFIKDNFSEEERIMIEDIEQYECILLRHFCIPNFLFMKDILRPYCEQLVFIDCKNRFFMDDESP